MLKYARRGWAVGVPHSPEMITLPTESVLQSIECSLHSLKTFDGERTQITKRFVVGKDASNAWGVLGCGGVGPISRLFEYGTEDATVCIPTSSQDAVRRKIRLKPEDIFSLAPHEANGLMHLVAADFKSSRDIQPESHRTRIIPRNNIHAAMMVASIEGQRDDDEGYGGNINGHRSAKYFGMSDETRRFLNDTARCVCVSCLVLSSLLHALMRIYVFVVIPTLPLSTVEFQPVTSVEERRQIGIAMSSSRGQRQRLAEVHFLPR